MSKKNPFLKTFWLLWLFIVPAMLMAAPKQTQAGQELLDRANKLYSQARYPQAILMYRKAEDRGADPIACAFNTGNSYFQLQKLSEAAAAYRKAVTISDGEFLPALANMASVLYRLGAYAESIAAYHRVLRQDPDNASAWLYLAEAYSRTGDAVGMQKALENGRSLDPNDMSLVYQLAEVYLGMGEIDRAASLVREGYSRNPQETDFLIYLGDIYRAAGQLDPALNSWREAQAVQPENTELLYKIADALAEGGNSFLAMETLEKALQIKPNFSDAAIFLGNLAFDSKWWDKAIAAYRRAGQYGNLEAVQGLRNVAYEYEQKKWLDQTISTLQLALQIAPKDESLQAEIENYQAQLKGGAL